VIKANIIDIETSTLHYANVSFIPCAVSDKIHEVRQSQINFALQLLV